MPALDDDLSNFARAIVQGAEPSPRIDAGTHYSAAVAIGIYRNNYRGNLHDALACAYPVVERLVGRDFFRRIAREYIGRYGSQGGNLHDCGARMAEFPAAFEPAQDLVCLPDATQARYPELDLQALLASLLAQNVLIGFKLKDAS